MKSQIIDWTKLIASIVGSLILGLSGSYFTAIGVSTWYPDINKPWFNPPAWLFGPVWTVLFILIGSAFYLVWMKGLSSRKGKAALGVFLAQFTLNIAWSGIFFGMRNFWLAFVDIVALWGLILLTIKSFAKVDKRAGWLLWPYLFWVTFASILNLAVAVLN